MSESVSSDQILEKCPTSCSQISMKFYTDVAKYISRLNIKFHLHWTNRFQVMALFVDLPYIKFARKLTNG